MSWLSIVGLLVSLGAVVTPGYVAAPIGANPSDHPGAEATTGGAGLPDPVAAPIRAFPSGPSAGGGSGEVIVNTSDPAVTPNEGIRVNLTAYAAPPLPAATSFQVGVEEVIGNDDAVVGIFQNSTVGPVPFFSVFDNRTNAYLHLAYWRGYPLVEGTGYDFQLTDVNRTAWTLTVNGIPFGSSVANATYEFGTNVSTWARGLLFAEVANFAVSSPVPATVGVPLALAVERNRSWYLPRSGATHYLGTPGTRWGVAGRLEEPYLAPGEIVTGSTVANQTDGTLLWLGGPVPISLILTVSSPQVPATGTVGVTIEAKLPGGTPLPGVYVYVADSLGGTVIPSTAMTNNSGGVETFLQVPNASRAEVDLVAATVTLFGYRGNASGTVTVLPSVELFVTFSPATPTVPSGGSIRLTLVVRNASGGGAGGVLVSLSVSSPLIVSNGFVLTGANGSGTVTLSALSGPSRSVQIGYDLATPGTWGHGNLTVAIGPSVTRPPGFLAQYGLATGAGIAVAVAVLVYIWKRPRRKAIPEMRLREYLREHRRAAGSTPAPSRLNPDAPRTPPQP